MAEDNMSKKDADIEKAYLQLLYAQIDVDTRCSTAIAPETAKKHMVTDPATLKAFELIQLYKIAEATKKRGTAICRELQTIARCVH